MLWLLYMCSKTSASCFILSKWHQRVQSEWTINHIGYLTIVFFFKPFNQYIQCSMHTVKHFTFGDFFIFSDRCFLNLFHEYIISMGVCKWENGFLDLVTTDEALEWQLSLLCIQFKQESRSLHKGKSSTFEKSNYQNSVYNKRTKPNLML